MCCGVCVVFVWFVFDVVFVRMVCVSEVCVLWGVGVVCALFLWFVCLCVCGVCVVCLVSCVCVRGVCVR